MSHLSMEETMASNRKEVHSPGASSDLLVWSFLEKCNNFLYFWPYGESPLLSDVVDPSSLGRAEGLSFNEGLMALIRCRARSTVVGVSRVNVHLTQLFWY